MPHIIILLPDNKQNSTEYILNISLALFNSYWIIAASILADWKEFQGVSKARDLSRQKGTRNKEVILGKKWIAYGKVIFLKRMAEVHKTDYLIIVDQTIRN